MRHEGRHAASLDRTYFGKSLLIGCAVLAVLIGGVGLFVMQLIGEMVTDYSTIPPAVLFADVFQSPLPKGVKRVTVAGHGFAGGQMFWMRIEADRATTQAMKQWGYHIDYPAFEQMAPSSRRMHGTNGSNGRRDGMIPAASATSPCATSPTPMARFVIPGSASWLLMMPTGLSTFRRRGSSPLP
jgi:hypothetical protein